MHATTDLDRRMNDKRKALRQEAAGEPTTGQEPARGSGAGKSKGDRWTAYNAFVDVIAPRLTLAERAVWFVMFRHARNGVCDISERGIATQANIDKATAGKALRQLVALRLVWVVFRSTSKEKPSRYGIHPSPADRLAAAIKLHDARTAAARNRRDSNGGDRRGRRRRLTNRVNSSPGWQDEPGE